MPVVLPAREETPFAVLLFPEREALESALIPTATFVELEFAPRDRESPFTVLGVIAPREKVKAVEVVVVAAVAETPLLVVTETA